MKRRIKKITLGFSVLSAYKKCPTKFSFAYLDKLTRPRFQDNTQGSPLTFGTLWHKFQELYHSGTSADQAMASVMTLAAASDLAHVYPEGKRSPLHLELMMQHYIDLFPDPNSDFKPYTQTDGKSAFEFETSFLLSTNPVVEWRQRYDGLVTMPDGSTAILEHKTSSSDLRKELRNRMMPNAQAVGYIYGARRALNISATSVFFNGACTYRPLVNPNYKYRGQGTPWPLFLREPVIVEEWRLEQWEEQTLRVVKRMIEDIEDGVFGDDSPDSCTLFNGRCKFAQLCNAKPLDREHIKLLDYEKDAYDGFRIEFE